MGRTSKNIKLRIPEKPHKIKGFRSGSYRVATMISSADPSTAWVHLRIFPPVFNSQKLLERKAGEKAKKYSIWNFENPELAGVFEGTKFTDPAEISSRSRYDLFDSPPYISTVFRALRKCKKNRQERHEILKLELGKTLINQGFSAEKTARANAHFECCTFDHSDNSPCLFSSGFLSRNLLKNSLERKQERRQKIFDFEIFCVEEYQGESGGRNSQLLPKFRVLHPWAM